MNYFDKFTYTKINKFIYLYIYLSITWLINYLINLLAKAMN